MTGIPEVSTTLGQVDALLLRTLDELASDWRTIAGDASDVLDADDLPTLIAEAAAGGKRLRPAMVHWGWVAAGAPAGAHDEVVRLGAALELLHVFALVHDDVMDRSELRRGNPSVHARARDAHRLRGRFGTARDFGDHIAILAGDLVHSEADALVAGLPGVVRQVWRTMMLELVLGQRLDLTGAATGRRDLAQARRVAQLKSGSYTVERPLQMGALLGNADEALVDCLVRYGQHAGEAFGLRDDVLGTWGDPHTTGKSSSDDLASGKPTVLLALAADRLDSGDVGLLHAAGVRPLEDAEMARLRRSMDACGIRAQVETWIGEQVDLAVAALDPDHVTPGAVRGLTAAAHRIAWRNS